MDYIESLPTDNEPLNPEEKQFAETILQKDATKFHKFLAELKLPLIIGILFLIINSPQVSNFLRDNVAYAKSSEMSLLCFKAALFMTAVFIYNNVNYIMK
jgi:hypothetical protein